MSNVEHPNIDCFYLENALEFLFKAEKNKLENYKNALYYLEKINCNNIVYPKYAEKMLIDKLLKILENIEDKKIDLIIYSVINLKLSLAKHWLREYIEEQKEQQ